MKKQLFALLFLCVVLCAGCAIQSSAETPAEPGSAAVSTQGVSAPDESAETHEQEANSSINNEAPAESASSKSLPLEGHIICVDPGHCVTDEIGKGGQEQLSPLSNQTKTAFGGGTHGANMTEEKLNLSVGLNLRDALETAGAQVIMTREVSEITLSGQKRCQIAQDGNAEVMVHIHADGYSDTSVHGVSVLVPSGDLLGTPSIVKESERLGKLMVDAVATATGAKNRGTSGRSDMVGFNYATMPTVLIEMGFMTNPEEDALLESDVYQDKIVQGMVDSICDWYAVDGYE
ncbi:N-acetylmuramoyl-L-alanine amidase family protein [Oscillibacter ruminantium]|uniref:N-acetylmuramoyl-L-alanine amidase family protein n=1 Tax=Oscillibacter ruminantium TaxID=1263547 RepID=UPI0002D5F75C|nr:N-acetylmuramoyl-L-alanine amidase [Oscillibacter ruminantium]